MTHSRDPLRARRAAMMVETTRIALIISIGPPLPPMIVSELRYSMDPPQAELSPAKIGARFFPPSRDVVRRLGNARRSA